MVWFVYVFFLCVVFKYVKFGGIVGFIDGEFWVISVCVYFGCYGDDYYGNVSVCYFVWNKNRKRCEVSDLL